MCGILFQVSVWGLRLQVPVKVPAKRFFLLKGRGRMEIALELMVFCARSGYTKSLRPAWSLTLPGPQTCHFRVLSV